MRVLRQVGYVLLFCLCAGTMCLAQETTIHVRLIDGQTGKPVTNKFVFVVTDVDLEGGELPRTDATGATVATLNKSTKILMVHDTSNYRCDVTKQDAYASYSIEEILAHGIASPNLCGKVHTNPTKGELLIYVRKPHFGESVRDVIKGLLICG